MNDKINANNILEEPGDKVIHATGIKLQVLSEGNKEHKSVSFDQIEDGYNQIPRDSNLQIADNPVSLSAFRKEPLDEQVTDGAKPGKDLQGFNMSFKKGSVSKIEMTQVLYVPPFIVLHALSSSFQTSATLIQHV